MLVVICRWRGAWLARFYRRTGTGTARLALLAAGSWPYVRAQLRQKLGELRVQPDRLGSSLNATFTGEHEAQIDATGSEQATERDERSRGGRQRA
ncbi:MAG: hypothetical protein AMXMBFR56_66150 [Polyangiaceae bacterium]